MTVASQIRSGEWDITVDVMGELLRKNNELLTKQFKNGKKTITSPFPCGHSFLLLFMCGR
jgi:hypothetical protein